MEENQCIAWPQGEGNMAILSQVNHEIKVHSPLSNNFLTLQKILHSHCQLIS